MQITFNTESALDRRLIEVLLVSLSTQQDAQPEVANTGSAESVVASSDDHSADSGAVSVLSLAEAASTVDPPKRKPKKHVEREVTLEQTIDEAPTYTYPPSDFDGVKKALGIYTQTKGFPAGVKLLSKYKAARISELAEDQYPQFVKDCIDGTR